VRHIRQLVRKRSSIVIVGTHTYMFTQNPPAGTPCWAIPLGRRPYLAETYSATGNHLGNRSEAPAADDYWGPLLKASYYCAALWRAS
jgi:hypothetical protein